MKETTVTLSLGFIAGNTTSTNNPYYFYDYFKVEQADLSKVDDAGYEAVYSDVTEKFMHNPGFDIEQDFQNHDVSNGASNHHKATNWTTDNHADFGSSAVFSFKNPKKLNKVTSPDNNTYGETSGGCLGIVQGWGAEACYKQSIQLPKGTYRISYSVYNAANDETEITSRCGYKIQDNPFVYDTQNRFNVGTWTERLLPEFTINESTPITISLGYKAANTTSDKHPFLFFDYVMIEQIGDKETLGLHKIRYNSSQKGMGTATIYSTEGVKRPTLQRGLNIIKYADGSTQKVIQK